MASDTVPAAVPGPHDPPPSTAPAGQQASGMAGLLAPVESPRAAFSLDTAPTTETASTEQAVTDASSATITPENATDNSDGNTSKTQTGKQQQSVIKAWMLAGAERWKKGADARNKRLDIQKARAQSMQVKETRQVSVNRTDGFSGNGSGKGNSNSGTGKSLNQKNSPSNSGTKGPKNSSLTPRNGTGNTPSGGRGNNSGPVRKPQDTRTDRPKTPHRDQTSGGGGKGRDRTPDKPKPARPDSGSGSKKTPASDAKPKNTSSGTGGTSNQGAKSGGQGPAGKPGKDAPTPNKPSPRNSSSAGTGSAQKADSKDRPWKDPARKPRLDKDPNAADTPGRDTRDRNAPGKTDDTKKPSTDTAAKKTPAPTDPKNKSINTGPGKDPASRPNLTRSTDPRTARPRINLQSSREAGYRDGTRVGKTTAHARAWRDGVRDGYRDTTAAADRETARLDKAHADRKKTRTTEAPTMPQAQTAGPTIPPKPDHQPGPQPLPVTSVDATHVHLGDSAARASISRGEVRTLRSFQQRLTDKTERMTTVAEATRTLEQHAREQAKQVNELLEQARAVQGGDKVVAALTKLAEAAQVQETKAADIHRRAARSADACQAVHANTETRYGGIYQAVVDSPETSPAELAYYQDMETTRV